MSNNTHIASTRGIKRGLGNQYKGHIERGLGNQYQGHIERAGQPVPGEYRDFQVNSNIIPLLREGN